MTSEEEHSIEKGRSYLLLDRNRCSLRIATAFTQRRAASITLYNENPIFN
jgi:hypothetical protein